MDSLKFKYVALISLLFLALSCGPSARYITLEESVKARYPVEFEGKTIALFFTPSGSESKGLAPLYNDSLFMESVVRGIANNLEHKLKLPSESIWSFALDEIGAIDREYIRELAFVANSDLLFLLDTLSIETVGVEKRYYITPSGEGREGSFLLGEVRSSLRLFSAREATEIVTLHQVDTAYMELFSRSDFRVENFPTVMERGVPTIGVQLGEELSNLLFPSWHSVERKLWLYPTTSWKEALLYASKMRWEEATKIWMGSTHEKDRIKVAAATYNLAVASELTERLELAIKWIDRSLELHPLPGAQAYKLYLIEKFQKE